MQNNYQHLGYIKLNDYDTKSELPVHVVLGNSFYTEIKTQENQGGAFSGVNRGIN